MEPPREGATYTVEREFAPEDVERFAELSGDRQPRHLEPDGDGRRLVHGLLTATLPTKLGGELEILAREMTFEFVRPVYTGEPITCELALDSVTEREDRVDVTGTITCRNDDGDVVLRGSLAGLIEAE